MAHRAECDTGSTCPTFGDKRTLVRRPLVRGRDASYLAPPAQIRTGPIRAYGSRLGCLTAKRAAGQGWRIRDAGSQSSTSVFIRSKVVESLSLRRVSERRHRFADMMAEC